METILDSEHYYYVCDDLGYCIGLEPADSRPKKRVRANPFAQNAYLRPNGSVKREEDLIVACQRMWLHNAYKPDGFMYRKHLENFYKNQK